MLQTCILALDGSRPTFRRAQRRRGSCLRLFCLTSANMRIDTEERHRVVERSRDVVCRMSWSTSEGPITATLARSGMVAKEVKLVGSQQEQEEAGRVVPLL